MMIELTVYSRRGCHLCEEMLEELEPLCRGRARIRLADVDDREDWVERYGDAVPVLCCDGNEICRHRIDRTALQALFDGFSG